MSSNDEDIACPQELGVKGIAAHTAIMSLLRERDATQMGGCKAFYSPAEWTVRGEKYGLESVLIVCHDGGEHTAYFNFDYLEYDRMEEMRLALAMAGVWVEQCTSWYSAVYVD